MIHPVVYKSRDGSIHNARQLTLGEVAEVTEQVWQTERIRLVEDLASIDAESGFKAEAMTELRNQRGLASFLLLQVFKVEVALLVLSRTMETTENINSADAVNIAMKCLGYEEEDGQSENPTVAPSQP